MRLVLHTAAYWLMLELRDAIPKPHPLAAAEFATLREKLLKVGARIVETASRIRLALATGCPQAELFRLLAGTITTGRAVSDGAETTSAPLDHPSLKLQRVRKYGSTKRHGRIA